MTNPLLSTKRMAILFEGPDELVLQVNTTACVSSGRATQRVSTEIDSGRWCENDLNDG
jgi:hypothetical protein